MRHLSHRAGYRAKKRHLVRHQPSHPSLREKHNENKAATAPVVETWTAARGFESTAEVRIFIDPLMPRAEAARQLRLLAERLEAMDIDEQADDDF